MRVMRRSTNAHIFPNNLLFSSHPTLHSATCLSDGRSRDDASSSLLLLPFSIHPAANRTNDSVADLFDVQEPPSSQRLLFFFQPLYSNSPPPPPLVSATLHLSKRRNFVPSPYVLCRRIRRRLLRRLYLWYLSEMQQKARHLFLCLSYLSSFILHDNVP